MSATSQHYRARALLTVLAVMACACTLSCTDERAESLHAMAMRIESTSDPDSTAVLVVLDQDLLDQVRSRLPKKFVVVAYQFPDTPGHDTFSPAQFGQMYRAASAATERNPEVWVVGMRPDSPGRRRAARFAQQAASRHRRPVLRDSLITSHGAIVFSHWVDRPAGAAQRAEDTRAMVWADSVIAAGPPKRVPLTVPFSRSELMMDPDTLAYFMAKLPDTSFYSIGGCSEVELVMWDAVERLSRMGPGVVPVLIERIDDPDSFVRERVQEALSSATQDERILARTNGEYLHFYDNPATASEVARNWWARFGHFWTLADTVRRDR